MPDTLPPDDYDHREVTQEEYDAFYADMEATPIDLPTAEEVREMARRYGMDDLPF